MIPNLILFGLIFGHWWRSSLIAAALGWPIVLVTTDVIGLESGLLGAAGLAVINTSIGVLVHQSGVRAVTFLRHRKGSAQTG